MIRVLVLAASLVLVAGCRHLTTDTFDNAALEEAIESMDLETACVRFWATKSRAHGQLTLLSREEISRLQEINISGTISCSEPQDDPGATSLEVLGYVKEMLAMMGESA